MQHRIVPHIVERKTVITLKPETSVLEAAETMAEHHIGAVLVCRDEGLAGIFTERDVLTRVVAKGLDPKKTKVSEVMTSNPDTVGPQDVAMTALQKMAERGYRHLPVVEGEKVIGIVSQRDLYAAVKRELEDDIQQRDAFIFGAGYGAG